MESLFGMLDQNKTVPGVKRGSLGEASLFRGLKHELRDDICAVSQNLPSLVSLFPFKFQKLLVAVKLASH